MLNLITSEWLKLTRRPLTWILLVVFLVLLVLQYWQFYFISSVAAALLNPAQVADVRARLAFPGAFGAAFGHINGLGGVFAVVLAAGAVGGDYAWGTLRSYLPRRPNRVHYLLAKIIVLLLALLVAMLLTLLCSVLAAVGFGSMLGGSGRLELAALAQLPLALLRALLVLLPYLLATVAATVYGRSLLFGLVAGMLFQFIDIGFGVVTTFARLGGIWPYVYALMVQANINRLTYQNSTTFGLDPTAIDRNFDPLLLPATPQALAVIAAYSALFLWSALHWFRVRDVGGQG